jgi:hypothetical protein
MDCLRGNYLFDALGDCQGEKGGEEIVLTIIWTLITSRFGGWIVGGFLVVLVGGAFYLDRKWTAARHEAQVKVLQEANLKLEIETKAQKATITFLEKQKTVKARATSEKTEIDQTVQAGDDARLRELFVNHGLLAPKAGVAPGRPPSRP